MGLAEKQPLKVFEKLSTSHSPRQRLYDDFRAVTVAMLAEELVGVITRLVDFSGHVFAQCKLSTSRRDASSR